MGQKKEADNKGAVRKTFRPSTLFCVIRICLLVDLIDKRHIRAALYLIKVLRVVSCQPLHDVVGGGHALEALLVDGPILDLRSFFLQLRRVAGYTGGFNPFG
jgi:hypothetical protein